MSDVVLTIFLRSMGPIFKRKDDEKDDCFLVRICSFLALRIARDLEFIQLEIQSLKRYHPYIFINRQSFKRYYIRDVLVFGHSSSEKRLNFRPFRDTLFP